MKYIKSYYSERDYKEHLNYFFRLFKDENFLNLDNKQYYEIFINSFNKIINDLMNEKIKSDKKLFMTFHDEIKYLMKNNNVLKKEIERHNFYDFEFKTNQYLGYNGYLNHDFFRLKIKDEYKYI